ncbi:TPA: hypothetical protein SB497_001840, partial [Campylobacter jejuni]|nr:hypothetical protein [Campylobacter jejuni]HEG0462121.1 hypothetical protein [Campylobacter jejuni]
MASCANAKLNSEIKTYDEANKNLKARPVASVYTPQARVNTTINQSLSNTQTISGTDNTLVIGSGGTITIASSQAVDFQTGSSTSTFKNQGTLIGGNNAASVNLGTNQKNGVTIETFTNEGIIGNGSSKFGITVWGTIDNKSTINNFSNSGTIHSDAGESIYFSNVNISNFANSEAIKSNSGKGVNMASEVSIENFTNSGTINGTYGVFLGSNSEATTFTNDGTIIGAKGEVSSGVLLDGSKIKTLENKASIIGDSESGRFVAGVIVRNGSTLSNINNSGTIQANGKRDSFGISVENAKIETLINSGFISGEKSGIYGASNSRIDSILNTGTIFGKQYGIIVDYGSYGDITIKDGGKIIGNRGIMIGQWQTMGALKVEGENSEIKGTQYGLYIGTGSQSTTIDILKGAQISGGEAGIYLDHGFLNGTTTVDNSVIHGNKAGIYLARGSSLNGTLEVKNGGIISGGVLTKDGMTTGYGIVNADSAKITGSVLVNSGGKITGLLNTGNASLLGDIIVEGKDSEVIGGISNSGNGKIEGSIKLENGGKIDTIVNSGNASISGDITVGAESDLSSIVNSDNANLGGNIKNDGNLGSIENSGSISGGIENNNGDLNIKNDGDLGGSIVAGGNGNTSISNGSNGNINGGIAVGSGSKVDIDNQGSVGKDENGNTITVESGGSVGIKDWVVSTDKETGKLDTVVVGGSGKDNVKVDNITVDQGNVNLEELGNINNIISGVNQNNIGNIGTNGGGEISLSFDPITGKLTTDFNLNASISGATFRSLISTTSRRSTFIDNVMGNSMQTFALASSSKSQSIAMSEKGNLYADASDYIKSDLNNGSYGSNKEHSLFILPYTSSQNVELS